MRRAAPLAFTALIFANLALALGPWMVRLADVGPVAAGFWRLALALPVLVWFAARQQRGRPLPGWPLVVAIGVGGLFFAADIAAWHEGILRTSLANSTLFGNFASFLFAIYGFILIGRLPSKLQAIALALAILGTFLLLGRSLELSAARLSGDLLALLAGLLYAFYLIAVERARQHLAPMPVLAIATVAGVFPLLALALALGEPVLPGNWTPVILLSIGSQLIGQGLLVYAMGHITPILVGLAFLIQPIAAAAIGWIVYREQLTLADFAGAALICVALVLIRARPPAVASAAHEDH